jgi:hypothetical protein
VQQVDHVFAGDVAGRAVRVGAAAEAGDRGVDDADAGFDAGNTLASA